MLKFKIKKEFLEKILEEGKKEIEYKVEDAVPFVYFDDGGIGISWVDENLMVKMKGKLSNRQLINILGYAIYNFEKIKEVFEKLEE